MLGASLSTEYWKATFLESTNTPSSLVQQFRHFSRIQAIAVIIVAVLPPLTQAAIHYLVNLGPVAVAIMDRIMVHYN